MNNYKNKYIKYKCKYKQYGNGFINKDRIIHEDQNLCEFCLEKIFENLEESENNIAYYNCNHFFHITCIYNSLQSGNHTCPVCRNDMNINYAKATIRKNKVTLQDLYSNKVEQIIGKHIFEIKYKNLELESENRTNIDFIEKMIEEILNINIINRENYYLLIYYILFNQQILDKRKLTNEYLQEKEIIYDKIKEFVDNKTILKKDIRYIFDLKKIIIDMLNLRIKILKFTSDKEKDAINKKAKEISTKDLIKLYSKLCDLSINTLTYLKISTNINIENIIDNLFQNEMKYRKEFNVILSPLKTADTYIYLFQFNFKEDIPLNELINLEDMRSDIKYIYDMENLLHSSFLEIIDNLNNKQKTKIYNHEDAILTNDELSYIKITLNILNENRKTNNEKLEYFIRLLKRKIEILKTYSSIKENTKPLMAPRASRASEMRFAPETRTAPDIPSASDIPSA
jgi:hypothetical protein